MPLPDSWPVLAVALPAVLGYGELRAKVALLRKDTDAKATQEVVDVQYREIIRQLDRIEDRINKREVRAGDAA